MAKFDDIERIVGRRSREPEVVEVLDESILYPDADKRDAVKQAAKKLDPRVGIKKPWSKTRPGDTPGRKATPNAIQLLAGNKEKGESPLATSACNDYLRMGPARSIAGLHRAYIANDPNYHRSMNSLYHYSWDFNWARRAEEYDARMEAQKNLVAAETLATGLATATTRIERLKRLAQLLEEEIARPGRLYIEDTKQVGTGRFAKQVKTIRFNSALVDQYRGALDDIAKETGGRSKAAGSDGMPVRIEVSVKNNEVVSEEGVPKPKQEIESDDDFTFDAPDVELAISEDADDS